MSTAIESTRWAWEEFERLPERSGVAYEFYFGELWVTPPPLNPHNEIVARLTHILVPYVDAQRLGYVYHPSTAFGTAREVCFEPDMQVRQPHPDRAGSWDSAPRPSLVVEVLSRSTRRRDEGRKLDYYMERGIPTYWIVDGDARTFTVVEPGRDPRIVTDTMTWHASAATEPLVFDVARVFG